MATGRAINTSMNPSAREQLKALRREQRSLSQLVVALERYLRCRHDRIGEESHRPSDSLLSNLVEFPAACARRRQAGSGELQS